MSASVEGVVTEQTRFESRVGLAGETATTGAPGGVLRMVRPGETTAVPDDVASIGVISIVITSPLMNSELASEAESVPMGVVPANHSYEYSGRSPSGSTQPAGVAVSVVVV